MLAGPARELRVAEQAVAEGADPDVQVLGGGPGVHSSRRARLDGVVGAERRPARPGPRDLGELELDPGIGHQSGPPAGTLVRSGFSLRKSRFSTLIWLFTCASEMFSAGLLYRTCTTAGMVTTFQGTAARAIRATVACSSAACRARNPGSSSRSRKWACIVPHCRRDRVALADLLVALRFARRLMLCSPFRIVAGVGSPLPPAPHLIGR